MVPHHSWEDEDTLSDFENLVLSIGVNTELNKE
jgi:hypothetical protein